MFKILIIDSQGRVLGVTSEVSLRNGTDMLCIGAGGIPKNLRTNYVGAGVIGFTWDKPVCDGKNGQIDGFEYMVSRKKFMFHKV